MQIQWFPGHMHKARKEIQKILPQVDAIVEVLDARIPYSSENPMISDLRQGKPCIKLLNKSDLADPALTTIWRKHFEEKRELSALATNLGEPDSFKQISSVCRKLFPHKLNNFKPIQVMIAGIPNVGKSSIINILAGRSIAKTGNEPAVTKAQQKIRLDRDIQLLDTPGVLWPNVENRHSGFRLAATGAIRDTAIDHSEVVFYLIAYFMRSYPSLITERYKLDFAPQSELEAMESIGKKRGCLGSQGIVDFDRVAKIVLNDLRSGKLGRLTLETPEMMLKELTEVESLRQRKVEKKKQRLEQRKKNKN